MIVYDIRGYIYDVKSASARLNSLVHTHERYYRSQREFERWFAGEQKEFLFLGVERPSKNFMVKQVTLGLL